MGKLKSHAYQKRCDKCMDIILDSEYEWSGPGHPCNHKKPENIDHVLSSCEKCSTCSFFTPIEESWGYCKMLPPGKNEVSEVYNYCKWREIYNG